MADTEVTIQRPQRWDVPFGEEMTPDDVDRLLPIEPLASVDASRFPDSCSLRDILLNDTRVLRFSEGDIVVREGDYGASAFLVLHGSVRLFLESLPPKMLGRRQRRRRGWFESLAQMWTNARYPEVRRYGGAETGDELGHRQSGNSTRIFLQDVPGVLDRYNSSQLGAGEIFGEVAAMARSPRSATVVAADNTALLEIRWQGLREIIRRSPALKEHIERLYRTNSLESHLRETPLLRNVSEADLQRVADGTVFESYGEFEWQAKFLAIQQAGFAERLEAEPIIVEEGEPADGLILIRSGFARLSQRYGDGQRTLAYLGKGQVYGLEELVRSSTDRTETPLRHSLRAVGYVDILRLPTKIAEPYILPTLGRRETSLLLNATRSPAARTDSAPSNGHSRRRVDVPIETGMLEFIVENRLMNGTRTMLIDLDRCTRCDDCVRACATAHDNNTRFERQGLKYGQYLFAQACMHCADPVCMIGCPTGAIGREEQSGNVVINDQTCIGCATCANSCPYENIRMVEIRDNGGRFLVDELTRQPIVKATKCDLCSDQLGGPACQRACPHDALVRMDMNDLPQLSQWLAR